MNKHIVTLVMTTTVVYQVDGAPDGTDAANCVTALREGGDVGLLRLKQQCKKVWLAGNAKTMQTVRTTRVLG